MIRNAVAGLGFVLGAVNAIGGEEAVLKVIGDRVNEAPPGLRICRHGTGTLLRYIRTLFFLPAFDMERPIELDAYEGKTLGAVTSPDGKHIRYRTADRFLRELSSLGAGNDLSLSLASCYYKTFYGLDTMPVYIDGHFKAVWTLKNIPKGKHGMMDRVMPGLKQVFLNGGDGHPLLHRTCPGDRHLTKDILPIVKDFEKAIGREVVSVVVFDGEGCSLDVFKAFDQLNKGRDKSIYPLTILDSNQYRREDFKAGDGNPPREKDFAVYKRSKNGRVKSRTALVEFDYLSNANRRRKGKEYPMRCALVKKENEKLTAIVTTMPYAEIGSGAELADLYYNRWPCQEAKFKEMGKLCNFKTNHGFKKKEVSNRTAAKRLEKTEKSLAYDTRRLENLRCKLEKTGRQTARKNARMQKALQKLEGQIERARRMLRDGRGDASKQRAMLEKKLRQLGRTEGKYREKIKLLQGRETELEKKMGKVSKSIEKNREEVERWRRELDEKPLYEMDTEMDHVMTNLKILYENSLLYAKDVFFQARAGMDMMHRQFINHYGDIEVEEGKRLRFRLNRFDDKGMTKKARRACRIFNEMKIKTADGIRLEMTVKR